MVVVVEVVVTFIEVGLVVIAGVVVEAVLAFEDVVAVVTVDFEQDDLPGLTGSTGYLTLFYQNRPAAP